MQDRLFGGSLEKYKSFEIFPLIISCILSIWYIKFIYNKLENQSFYVKLIMFSEDPEDRSILTEYFQHRLLVACYIQYNACVKTTFAASDLHSLMQEQLFFFMMLLFT